MCVCVCVCAGENVIQRTKTSDICALRTHADMSMTILLGTDGCLQTYEVRYARSPVLLSDTGRLDLRHGIPRAFGSGQRLNESVDWSLVSCGAWAALTLWRVKLSIFMVRIQIAI